MVILSTEENGNIIMLHILKDNRKIEGTFTCHIVLG